MSFRNSLWVRKQFLCTLSLVVISPLAVADNIESAGDALQFLIPAVAYGATFYLDDEAGRNQFYKSFFTNFGVTEVLKYGVNRKRPNGGDGSFPSGHTSAAFQGASFVQFRYGLNYSLPLYALSAVTGYSRVHAHKHYWSDVAAGAAIGIGSSYFFTTNKNASVTPMVGESGVSVVLTKAW